MTDTIEAVLARIDQQQLAQELVDAASVGACAASPARAGRTRRSDRGRARHRWDSDTAELTTVVPARLRPLLDHHLTELEPSARDTLDALAVLSPIALADLAAVLDTEPRLVAPSSSDSTALVTRSTYTGATRPPLRNALGDYIDLGVT